MLGRSLKIASVLTLMALAAAAQTIPAGTRLTVRVGSEISSGTAKAGDRFDATLARPLVVNGKTPARTGATVRGKVTSAKSSGRLHAPGELTLRLTGSKSKIERHPLPTDDPKVRKPDITQARTRLGWEPKVQLEQGLTEAIAYFRSRLG